jgi:hypothetical protein
MGLRRQRTRILNLHLALVTINKNDDFTLGLPLDFKCIPTRKL